MVYFDYLYQMYIQKHNLNYCDYFLIYLKKLLFELEISILFELEISILFELLSLTSTKSI